MSQASASSQSGVNATYGTDLTAFTPALIAVAVIAGVVALLWIVLKK